MESRNREIHNKPTTKVQSEEISQCIFIPVLKSFLLMHPLLIQPEAEGTIPSDAIYKDYLPGAQNKEEKVKIVN